MICLLKHQKNKKKKTDLDTIELNKDLDLAGDVEFATYIDARERYDYLHSKYERIVRDNYLKNKEESKK